MEYYRNLALALLYPLQKAFMRRFQLMDVAPPMTMVFVTYKLSYFVNSGHTAKQRLHPYTQARRLDYSASTWRRKGYRAHKAPTARRHKHLIYAAHSNSTHGFIAQSDI